MHARIAGRNLAMDWNTESDESPSCPSHEALFGEPSMHVNIARQHHHRCHGLGGSSNGGGRRHKPPPAIAGCGGPGRAVKAVGVAGARGGNRVGHELVPVAERHVAGDVHQGNREVNLRVAATALKKHRSATEAPLLSVFPVLSWISR